MAGLSLFRGFLLRSTPAVLTDKRGGPDRSMLSNPMNRGLSQGGHVFRGRILRDMLGSKIPSAGNYQDPAITWHKGCRKNRMGNFKLRMAKDGTRFGPQRIISAGSSSRGRNVFLR